MECAPAGHFDERGIVARDADGTARERFEERQPESLVPRRVAESGGSPEEGRQLVVANVSEQHCILQVRRIDALQRADEHERMIASQCLRHGAPSLQQRVHPFAESQRTHVQDVAPGHGARDRAVGTKSAAHPVRDDPDAVMTRVARRVCMRSAGAKWRTRAGSSVSGTMIVDRSWTVTTTGPLKGGAAWFVSW